MKFVYFTKMLKGQDVAGMIAFCKETGLDGADLAVRPGYPVTPENVATELPRAAKAFREAGLILGLVTAPTDLVNPSAKSAQALFEACGQVGVPAIKIGYFPYRGNFNEDLKQARTQMAGFAKLGEKTRVRACYHTHSGNFIGANGAVLRMLLQDLDPHHVGAFVDTGHVAVGGGPIRMEFDLVRPWLSLLAIKDIAWVKKDRIWSYHVIPAGDGIVRWKEVAVGLKESKFNGTISVHGEYDTRDYAERKTLAKAERAFLQKQFASV